MLLVIDIGNTNITMGVYKNNKLENVSTFKHCNDLIPNTVTTVFNSIYGNIHPKDCIISSVVDELTENVQNAVYEVYKLKPFIITSDYDIGVNLKVKNPETIGSDRLANICAAAKLYKKRPLIVVDSGSATTFDIIDKDNNFIGGVIMPGLEMQFNALNQFTSKLPLITYENFNKAHKIICANTKNEMTAGVIRGHICGIEGLLSLCQKELDAKPFVILTGGDAGTIEKYMQKKFFNAVHPDLTLEGAAILYEINV